MWGGNGTTKDAILTVCFAMRSRRLGPRCTPLLEINRRAGPERSSGAGMGTCVRVTSQGHPYARFRRALDSGNALEALASARELSQIALSDALELCLALRGDPRRYRPAVVRWHGRFVLETRGVTLEESQAVLALLASLPGSPRACAALAELLDRRGMERAAEALVRASRPVGVSRSSEEEG